MKFSRLWTWLALSLALVLLTPRSAATTVVPPEFDSLVNQADYIVRGVVTAVNSEWSNDIYGRHIISKVNFKVSEVIKGNPPSPLVLEMLGGRIGKDQMVVDGTPNFIIGEESIIFVHGNGRQFFPLVAIMYGMYPVTLDRTTGQKVVQRSNGSPMYDVKDVSKPMTAANAVGKGSPRLLTVVEFSNQIRASATQRQVSPPANAN